MSSRYVPGEEYIHYQEGDVTYAQRVSTGERFAIGWKSPQIIEPVSVEGQSAEDLYYDMLEQSLYEEIRRATKTNNTLKAEMERVKELYLLIKQHNKETIFHHPV